jgi:hypothetical protein
MLWNTHNESHSPKPYFLLQATAAIRKYVKVFSLLEYYADVDWWLGTDLSGQPIKSTILKGQAGFLDYLALEDGTDRLSRNVGN